MKPWLLVLLLLLPWVAHAEDTRFTVHLQGASQLDAAQLDIKAATKLALPILWKRVVPSSALVESEHWPVATSLVLRFKPSRYGVTVTFNPVQVQKFLARRNVSMIRQQPHWRLRIAVEGFDAENDALARDLLNYSYALADTYGIKLDSAGKVLNLSFLPVVDAAGALKLHVDVAGDFSAALLRRQDVPMQDNAVYQLQAFLKQVLLDIRDAYQHEMVFDARQATIILRVQTPDALVSQVMLEQALRKRNEVKSVVPVLLKHDMREYRLTLQGQDDSWLASWFAAYGLQASKQPEGSVYDWLVE